MKGITGIRGVRATAKQSSPNGNGIRALVDAKSEESSLSKGVTRAGGARKSHIAIAAIVGFLLAFLLLGSALVAVPFAFVASTAPKIRAKQKLEHRRTALASLWPEILDHMISGLRSGLSIAETLSGLADRGPEISRPIFKECRIILKSGGDITQAFALIKHEFNNPVADQVCEVLDFARGTGSRDTAVTLRTLGDFIRSDSAVRGEINAKLGWVKNSAIVAAIAPWILLIILSSQPSTLQAFETPSGNLILIVGVVLSGVAYLWMSRVGRIPTVPRIFAGSEK